MLKISINKKIFKLSYGSGPVGFSSFDIGVELGFKFVLKA